MRSKSVAFSGHRVIPADEKPIIYSKLLGTVKKLIEKGYTEFYAGGAVGFDMLAAFAVLEVRNEYTGINLHLVLPYRGHDERWSSIDRRKLETILSLATSVEYVNERYSKWCFSVRNKRMVDNAAVLVYYLTEEKGGTWGTVKYAAVNDLKMIKI